MNQSLLNVFFSHSLTLSNHLCLHGFSALALSEIIDSNNYLFFNQYFFHGVHLLFILIRQSFRNHRMMVREVGTKKKLKLRWNKNKSKIKLTILHLIVVKFNIIAIQTFNRNFIIIILQIFQICKIWNINNKSSILWRSEMMPLMEEKITFAWKWSELFSF